MRRGALIGCLAFFGGTGMLLVVLIVIAALHGGVRDATVLRVRLDGDMLETPSAGSLLLSSGDEITLGRLTGALRAAASDEQVAGVVLDIRQPQVGFAQLEELEDAMAAYRGSGKWSVAFLETAGELSRGDGVYAIAAMADRIVLAPSGDIGLVGLRAEVPFVKGTLEKLELTMRFEKRHAYKNAPNTFTEDGFTAEHREAVSTLLDDLQAGLIQHIAARRKVDASLVRTWIDQGPYSAADALAKGLVDELGYWDAVLARAKEANDRDDPFMEAADYADAALERGSGGTIALIIAEGTIARGESPGGFGDPSIGSDTFTQAFREARETKVDGVLFRIDSPGGSYLASDLIRREVELTREAGIPVVVSMGDVAASGGYFIAMLADHIVAQPGTITGSIGVYSGHIASRAFYENLLGVTWDSYQTGPAAGIYSSLDLPSPDQQRLVTGTVDRIYADFVGKAAAARDMTYDELHAVAQGRVWSGRAALERGLVDELGGLHVALARVLELAGLPKDQRPRFRVFPEEKTSLELLEELVGGARSARARIDELTLAARRAGLLPGEEAVQLRLPFVPRP